MRGVALRIRHRRMLLDIEVEIELAVLKVYLPDGLVIPDRRKASIYT